MKMNVLHVTTTKIPPYRSKIKNSSPLLAGLGFVCGAPVIAVPQQNGFLLMLRDARHPAEISRLIHNGKLIHVGQAGERPTITLNFAQNFATTGLTGGDFLAARFEYGLITAKKLPQAEKYCAVKTAILCLRGAWLDATGFLPGTVTTLSVRPGRIMLRAWDETAATYDEIVNFASKHQYQIIKPKPSTQGTFITLNSDMLSRAGFGTGDIIGIRYDFGRISLFKPDLRKLGF